MPGISISVKTKILAEFEDLIGNKDRSEAIEELMIAYIVREKHKKRSVTICEKCGETYPSTLQRCPECETIEIYHKNKLYEEQRAKAQETDKRINREIIESELNKHRENLRILNSPDSEVTSSGLETKRKIIERIQELEKALIELG